MTAVTPSAVKAYLADRQRSTLSDIAIHFGSSPDAVRQVLQVWMDKGRVRCLADGGCAGKTCACAKKPEDIYEWIK